VDALNNGGTLSDSFTVTTADGTSQVVNVTINGHTDATDVLAPTDIVFSLNAASATFSGNGLNSGDVLGSFTATDADSTSWTFALTGANASLFSLSPSGSQSSVNIAAASNIASGNYTFVMTATDTAGHSYNETYHVGVGTTGTDAAAFFTISSGTDVDFGLNGQDTINGGAGDDALVGGQNADTIFGGLGNDQLVGGAQNDTFVFDTTLNGTTNVDQILDFDANGDHIRLSPSIFGAIGATLDSGEFATNAGGNAVDPNDYVLFDSNTGNLYYDSDGNGAGAKILFAHVTVVNGVLDATDFVIG
jgi:serralysin